MPRKALHNDSKQESQLLFKEFDEGSRDYFILCTIPYWEEFFVNAMQQTSLAAETQIRAYYYLHMGGLQCHLAPGGKKQIWVVANQRTASCVCKRMVHRVP